jgi:hypothetical protein
VIRRPALPLAALSALLLGAGAAGCGWHAGLAPPPLESELQGPKRVAVEYFEARPELLVRGLEPLLQDQITLVLSDLVGARLVAPAQAELLVRGRILDYRRRGGIRNKDNQLLESGVRIVVSAELVDTRTGKTVRTPVTADVWSGYTAGPEQAVDNEREARDRALRHIAESLVLQLFAAQPAPDASAG